ncbi:hypothetical protein GCM10025331_84000 [Actinoplanes utahensis]|nr:hypothetical protein Aut01nite_67530 [Actinoplanes utahensis]
MVNYPEHGCLLPVSPCGTTGAPRARDHFHQRGSPDHGPAYPRRLHTGQVTLPRRTVHVGAWFRLLRTVLKEINTPVSFLRWKADKETLVRIRDCIERPVRAGQTRPPPHSCMPVAVTTQKPP